jgi:hypothetical protein
VSHELLENLTPADVSRSAASGGGPPNALEDLTPTDDLVRDRPSVEC